MVIQRGRVSDRTSEGCHVLPCRGTSYTGGMDHSLVVPELRQMTRWVDRGTEGLSRRVHSSFTVDGIPGRKFILCPPILFRRLRPFYLWSKSRTSRLKLGTTKLGTTTQVRGYTNSPLDPVQWAIKIGVRKGCPGPPRLCLIHHWEVT